MLQALLVACGSMWIRCNVLEVALCPTILWLSCVGVETWKLLPLVDNQENRKNWLQRIKKHQPKSADTYAYICIHENKLIYLCNCESQLHIHSESMFSKFHLDFMLQGMLQWQHLQADLWCRGSELWWSLTSSDFLLSKVREEHVTRHTGIPTKTVPNMGVSKNSGTPKWMVCNGTPY